MLKLLKYLKKKDWLQVFCGLIFICVQVWLDLKLPDYMSEITTLVQTPDSAMSSIWAAGGKMLLCALGSLASSIIVGFFASRLAATLSCRLRDGIYKKVESFSMEEIGNFSISMSDYPLYQRHHPNSNDRSYGHAGDDQSSYHGCLGNTENIREKLAVVFCDRLRGNHTSADRINFDAVCTSEIQGHSKNDRPSEPGHQRKPHRRTCHPCL